jgi:hypothetical protein
MCEFQQHEDDAQLSSHMLVDYCASCRKVATKRWPLYPNLDTRLDCETYNAIIIEVEVFVQV